MTNERFSTVARRGAAQEPEFVVLYLSATRRDLLRRNKRWPSTEICGFRGSARGGCANYRPGVECGDRSRRGEENVTVLLSVSVMSKSRWNLSIAGRK